MSASSFLDLSAKEALCCRQEGQTGAIQSPIFRDELQLLSLPVAALGKPSDVPMWEGTSPLWDGTSQNTGGRLDNFPGSPDGIGAMSEQLKLILHILEGHNRHFESLQQGQSRVHEELQVLRTSFKQGSQSIAHQSARAGAARHLGAKFPGRGVNDEEPVFDFARKKSQRTTTVTRLSKASNAQEEEGHSSSQAATRTGQSIASKSAAVSSCDESGVDSSNMQSLGDGIQSIAAMPLKAQRRATIGEEQVVEFQLDQVIRGKEIQEYDWLEAIVFNKWFELFFGMLILINTVLMAVQFQYTGGVAAAIVEFKDSHPPPEWLEDVLRVADKVLLGLFTVELLAKLICLRQKFWKDSWNLLDLGVVVSGLLDTFVDFIVGLDPMILRLVRLVKLIRFMKMFKMAGQVFVLNLILKSIRTTLPTLMWSVTLLFIFMAVFGLLIGQMVHDFIIDENGADLEVRQLVFKYYGSFTRVMFTMYEVTMVNYSRPARVLTHNVNEYWCFFFFPYRCFVSFGLLNVVRAVFIQQTMKVAENDRELLLIHRERQKDNVIRKLSEVFKIFDFQNNGKISEIEFMSVFRIPKMKAWLAALDLDPRFPENLFNLLDLRGCGLIDVNDFLAAASKLRGPSNSVDVIHLASLIDRLEEKLDLLIPRDLVEQCKTQTRLWS